MNEKILDDLKAKPKPNGRSKRSKAETATATRVKPKRTQCLRRTAKYHPFLRNSEHRRRKR